VNISNVLFVDWADRLVCSAVGRVLEHVGKADTALDSFTTSSLPQDIPLWSMDNVMITPQV
jgi:phosphoglycerate dehydrogenase-like enzyme